MRESFGSRGNKTCRAGLTHGVSEISIWVLEATLTCECLLSSVGDNAAAEDVAAESYLAVRGVVVGSRVAGDLDEESLGIGTEL